MVKLPMPTFRELIAAYEEIAQIERLKTGSPGEGTVRNVVRGVKYVVGEHLDEPATWMTRLRIDEYIVGALKAGLSPITVWGYVGQLQAITARWTRPYYVDRKMACPRFEIPVKKRKGARYRRPNRAKLLAVKNWYDSLTIRADRRDWLVATLMLEFGMRNGDIVRLTWGDFLEKDGRRFLVYTPHKTSLSSGRVVCWPVHRAIWEVLEKLQERPGEFVVPHALRVIRKLNAEIRQLGFKGSKACYELRKICIDHIYQKFGAEMASSISGDDIRTVMRYYADPSAVIVEGVRVVELL